MQNRATYKNRQEALQPNGGCKHYPKAWPAKGRNEEETRKKRGGAVDHNLSYLRTDISDYARNKMIECYDREEKESQPCKPLRGEINTLQVEKPQETAAAGGRDDKL